MAAQSTYSGSDVRGASANQTVSRYIKLLKQTDVRDNKPSVVDP